MADGFDAFVLTGGRSERMGRDKALITIDGVAMAARVAHALEDAGAATVTCVGGDVDGLRSLGLRAVADEHEGAGPLGGILSAFAHAERAMLLVVPCDVIAPDAAAFAQLVDALAATPSAGLATPVVDGVWRPLPCAVRTTARHVLAVAFDAGERAVHRAMGPLDRVEVDAGRFADADTPGDLDDRR